MNEHTLKTLILLTRLLTNLVELAKQLLSLAPLIQSHSVACSL